MKTWVLSERFGLDRLAIAERPAPSAERGQVVLEMSAWSLNYRDYLLVTGVYNPRQKLPFVPISDGVGRVVEVGPGVDHLAVGDRVCPLFFQKWFGGVPGKRELRSALSSPLDGVMSERIAIDAEGVMPVPAHLTDEQAATLPCAGLTAWSALFEQGTASAGDVLLVEGTGGVSMLALQLARAAGIDVIATSSSDEKLERARTLGASRTINYKKTEAWGRAARELTGGNGVDQVIDIGGAATLPQAIAAVRPHGTISIIGMIGGKAAEIDIIPVLMTGIRLQGVIVGSRTAFARMTRAIEKAAVAPVVDRTFAFDELVPALEHMAHGAHFGKICLKR
jgi:NADPH:quinone reductase-like Zn-dependent oxidoreductase